MITGEQKFERKEKVKERSASKSSLLGLEPGLSISPSLPPKEICDIPYDLSQLPVGTQPIQTEDPPSER